MRMQVLGFSVITDYTSDADGLNLCIFSASSYIPFSTLKTLFEMTISTSKHNYRDASASNCDEQQNKICGHHRGRARQAGDQGAALNVRSKGAPNQMMWGQYNCRRRTPGCGQWCKWLKDRTRYLNRSQ